MTGRRLAEAGSDSGGVVATGRTRGRVAALGGEADVELVESMAGSDEKALLGLWGDFSLSGERVHVQAAEVEEDVGLEAFAVAVAA